MIPRNALENGGEGAQPWSDLLPLPLFFSLSRSFPLLRRSVVSISRDCRRSKLNSTDGPQFRHPPVSVETQYGATEILQCDVDGNPTPEIRWYHEDSERQVATTPNISVVVNHETAGRYFCKAHVPGFQELTGYANIYIRAPPSIVSQRVQYVPDEGVVKVCAHDFPSTHRRLLLKVDRVREPRIRKLKSYGARESFACHEKPGTVQVRCATRIAREDMRSLSYGGLGLSSFRVKAV